VGTTYQNGDLLSFPLDFQLTRGGALSFRCPTAVFVISISLGTNFSHVSFFCSEIRLGFFFSCEPVHIFSFDSPFFLWLSFPCVSIALFLTRTFCQRSHTVFKLYRDRNSCTRCQNKRIYWYRIASATVSDMFQER
jgi:hypothetical protein